MLFEALLAPFWFIAGILVSFLPLDVVQGVVIGNSLTNAIAAGVHVIGASQFTMMMSVFVTFMGIQLGWAVIEWIYIKIPGVN
jgi:hypothetical protein